MRRLLVVAGYAERAWSWSRGAKVADHYPNSIKFVLPDTDPHSIRGLDPCQLAIVVLDDVNLPTALLRVLQTYWSTGAQTFDAADPDRCMRWLRPEMRMFRIAGGDTTVLWDAWLEGRTAEVNRIFADVGASAPVLAAVTGFFHQARDLGWRVAEVVWFETSGKVVSVDCVYDKPEARDA